MSQYSFSIFCLIFFLCGRINSIEAREVDPYLTARYTLKDSLHNLHQYMSQEMAKGLKKVNNQIFSAQIQQMSGSSCLAVAERMMLEFRSTGYQKIEKWADHAEGLDRAPSRQEMSDLDYIQNSYVEYSPLNFPFSRVINVGGIYVGSDKLGHFTSWGVRYLNTYLQNYKESKNEEQALVAAIKRGHESEHSYLGLQLTKIGSYADLRPTTRG